MWPHVQKVIWLNGLNFLLVSHHFAKFIGHNHCGSSNTVAKIVYVTLRDHVIKGSDDFMVENSSLYIPILPKVIVLDIVFVDI